MSALGQKRTFGLSLDRCSSVAASEKKSCSWGFLQTLRGAPGLGNGGTSLASLTTDRAGFYRTGTFRATADDLL